MKDYLENVVLQKSVLDTNTQLPGEKFCVRWFIRKYLREFQWFFSRAFTQKFPIALAISCPESFDTPSIECLVHIYTVGVNSLLELNI